MPMAIKQLKISPIILTLVLLAVSFGETSAQLVNPSSAALGMANNYTAAARGFGAISWNPAGLAMNDNPAFSMSLLPAQVVAGLGPIALADFSEFQGETLSLATKNDWLERITEKGGEDGLAGVDLTVLAMQWGRVGVQLSTTARVAASLGPGASQLILFGNAGRTGEPESFTLDGSSFDALAVTTAGISYAQPLIRDDNKALAIGVTLKQSFGNALASGMDSGSELRSDPLDVQLSFPLIHSDTAMNSPIDGGSGLSVDVGAAWQSGLLYAGVTMHNLVNSFAWDVEQLQYRPGTASAEGGDTETSSDFDAQPFSSAPDALKNHLDELGFARTLTVGLGYRIHPKLLLTADFRNAFEEALLSGPKSHMGMGAEISPVFWLPLRVGAAKITEGHLLTAGAGLRLGPLRFSGAATESSGEFGEGTSVMFTLSIGHF